MPLATSQPGLESWDASASPVRKGNEPNRVSAALSEVRHGTLAWWVVRNR